QREFTFDAQDFSQVSLNIEAFVVPRGEKKAVSIQDYTAEDEATARQIELESARIQREMERERRARSVSPLPTPRGTTPSPPPPAYRKSALRSASTRRVPSPVNHQAKLSRDISSMVANTSAHFSDAEDQLIAGHELKTLRQALYLTRKDLRETESQLKDARQLSEDAKSALMVLEFKRGSATKDLDRINEEIHRRKGQMSAVENELQVKVAEIKNMTSLGVTREDCLDAKATKEENLCLKTKVRSLEGLQLERDELVRQLEATKEDLLREQKASRLHRAELQEELEALSARLEESQNGWGTDHAQLAKMEAAFRRMEREKNEIIQAKICELEELRMLHKEEKSESQSRLRKEMNDLDLEVQEFRVRVNDLQSENGGKDTMIEKMRAQISDLQSILVKEREDRHKTSNEQKKALQHLKKETAAAVMKLKESLFLDKQKAVEDLKLELEQERRASGDRNEDRMSQMMEEHSYEIQQKNQEIMRLQDSIRKLEKDGQIKSDQQVREAVTRERERSDMEKDRQLRQEREDSKRRMADVTSQLDREKNASRELHSEISNLKKELDEQRRLQREASKEKLVAVARTKEQMKDQSTAEIDRVKFNLQQEHQRDVERLEEKLRYQEDELSSLKSEHDQIIQRERNVLLALEHAEKTVIKEINDECEKVSGILGVSPRTVHHTSFHLENVEGRMSPSFRSRPVINSALANLRACNDELHNHILELQQEVESLRVMVDTVTKEKEEAIENCKLQMEKQRTLDLEKLKDKLLKEHVQEMSDLVRDCAAGSPNQYSFLQRYPGLTASGDTQASLLAALKVKDEELRSLTRSTSLWKASLEEKFNTQLQLQMAKEREKYQAQQHHSTREQSRISDLQKQEIARLERELHRLATSQNHPVQDSNRYRTPSPPPATKQTTITNKTIPASVTNTATSAPTTTATSSLSPSSQLQQQQQQQRQRASSPSVTAAASTANLKSSQHLLQSRIEQLQAENAALRKNRLLGGGATTAPLAGRQHLAWSSPNLPELTRPQPIRPTSPLGRARSPQARASRMMIRERIRQGEKDALEAEERARVNQKAMSNKMEEMAQLQHTLISQNQELQELEKAYNDLHKQYSNSRPHSPSRDFNTTL
ncbi:hypothetical protein EGW08_022955, partial [Elysia chlorotica]